MHDIIDARTLLALIATSRWLIGDKAYGAADVHDPVRYKSRNVIERSFNRLKDWRGIATRYDKTARNFLSGICLAAAVTYWIR